MRLLLTIILLFLQSAIFSQESHHENLQTPKDHSPRLATALSALVPGAGQVYNKKYWKLPIIYGGFATFIHFGEVNNKFYLKWRRLYEQKLDGTIDDMYINISDETLRKERERWRRNRDLNYIGIGVLYFLQVIDATVDAHLFEYDISDDLTLRYEPTFEPFLLPDHKNSASAMGLRFSISF